MIVSHIDPDALSSHAAAKGFRALCEGDTVLAREKYSEAGKILESGAARIESGPEKNLLRFLAASQYYHGGDYQRAKRIVDRTKPMYLSESDREKFEAFRKDVDERADPEYPLRIRAAVFSARKTERWDAAIELLQRHPYVLERSALAWTRADLCLRSGRIKAAVLFSADAIRFSNYHPTPVFLRAGAGTFLKLHKKADEAAEFLRLVLDKQPTALDLVAVATDLYDKMKQGQADAGFELLRLIDVAQQEFAQLPLETTSDLDVRLCMAHGYLLAAITADRLRSRQEAIRYVDTGKVVAPPGLVADIFRLLGASAEGHWIHDPEIGKQLDSVTSQLGFRQLTIEEDYSSKASIAA